MTFFFTMKISFFVFIVFSKLSLSSTQSSSSVLDTDRNFLRYGTGYYILPIVRGRGGGISLTPTSINQKCPPNVVQENFDDRNGLPLSFIPANTTKDAIIRESSDLNIMFPVVTICGQPPVWRLEAMNGQWFISSRGTLGSPGMDTLSNWFKIERYGANGYKLVYCPTVCNTCKPVCGDIGVAKSGRRNLILSKEPLIVMFKKA